MLSVLIITSYHEIEIMICQTENCENPTEGRTTFCASCNRINRKALKDSLKEKKVYTINKKTAKLASAEAVYLKERKSWIENKQCAVFPHLKATECHHMKGRGFGFADQWAKDRGITLLMDKRFWLPVSFDGHQWIGANDALAREKGFVLSRLENLDYEPEII